MKTISHVLVAIDFSAPSRKALDAALAIATGADAELTLIHVVEPQFSTYAGMPFMPVVDLASEVEQGAWAQLKEMEGELKGRLKVTAIVRRGSPWREIVDQAVASGADLIAIGTQGHTGLARALIGSTAEKVVRMSKVPVLTVHAD